MKKALLLLCILALGVLFLLSGCTAPEAEEEAPAEEAAEAEEAPAEEAAEAEEAPVAAEEGAWLSGVSCTDSKIAATITNRGDTEVDITKDVIIALRGTLVVKSIECDKTVLAAGESAVCTDISGGYSLGTTNKITLKAPGGVSEGEVVTCVPAEEGAEEAAEEGAEE